MHRCRRSDGHRTASWHPTIDKKVRRYALEQRILQEEKAIGQLKSESLRVRSETEQIKKENVRLAELNSKLEAILASAKQ